MQAMQYRIDLPKDYNMDIIKQRVNENGSKTDGFPDLLFKAYLITEKETGCLANSYCPLYVWKNTNGMTEFIFDGYFDNIINSFGWKKIEIGITAKLNLSNSFHRSKFVLEEYHDISEQSALKQFDFEAKSHSGELGSLIIYNPEKWKYVTFTFFEKKPSITNSNLKIYSILHLSLEK